MLAGIRGAAPDEAAFRRALDVVGAHGVDSDADLGPLLSQPGVQSDVEVHTRLRHMYEAGGWVLLESAIADLPADLRWLFESGAVTIPQLAALYHELAAATVADLAEAVRTRAIRRVTGLDAEVESRVAAALPTLRNPGARVPLGRAMTIVDPLLRALEAQPGVAWARPAGSLRRGEEFVGDVEIVAASSAPDRALAAVRDLPDTVVQLARQGERLCLLIDRMTVSLRASTTEAAGGTLLYLTGSKAHVGQLRERAASLECQLTATGLVDARGRRIAATEEEIYAALDLAFIPPEVRSGRGEVHAAAAGELPRLIDVADIAGDLHMHTHYSDGRDSVEDMAAACEALGYAYMAITDHSPHSAASRNLTIDGVKRQADDIAAVRERHPALAILHGAEVDILPDGALDFPDAVLEQLDIVLASLHDGHGHSAEQLLERYRRAMRHPLVNIVTHPSNRIIPVRPGYDLDYDRLFETAVETGTIVEVDGAPAHLDMNGDLAARAHRAGARIAIDSDSHRADMLGRQMALGVVTARRGWVESRHVVNTRPLPELRDLLAAKRR